MLVHKKFEVKVTRDVSSKSMWMPGGRDSGFSSEAFMGNRAYSDLRGLTWKEAKETLAIELELIRRIELADDPKQEADSIDDELYEDFGGGMHGIDTGVASTVVALSAGKSVPYASCNGGAFGGHHHEKYPLVAFYARAENLKTLLEAAAEAEIGLCNGPEGSLVAYADDVRNMPAFAQALIQRSKEFRAPQTNKGKNKREKIVAPRKPGSQGTLF